MKERLEFLRNRLKEKLWVRPLLLALLAVTAAFAAHLADRFGLENRLPAVTMKSVVTLLSIMASSMLVIATFSVSSMVAAYASAASTATPRSFPVIVSDDVSQNALSTFVGAFIFAIVALVALENGFFGEAGRFTLFALTLAAFAIVIMTFIRWVDRIARLGRLGATVDKLEQATGRALNRWHDHPHLGGLPAPDSTPSGIAVYSESVGYVQRLDMSRIQGWAEERGARVRVAALPGTFITPDRALAWVEASDEAVGDEELAGLSEAFGIGTDRLFDQDPRYGLVVLSEVASRALSPAVNDPGTAIEVIGASTRLLVGWARPRPCPEESRDYDRVSVPALDEDKMLRDAFGAIGRDGAGLVEVMVRLQNALGALVHAENGRLASSARAVAVDSMARSEPALTLDDDRQRVRDAFEGRSA